MEPMASDWIPMRINLAHDPAVISIAARLGIDEFSVVGRLHRLWGWANDNLADGHARSVTPQWVNSFVCTPGFAEAMLEAGWLALRNGSIFFPNFDVWNSQSGKKRILSAKRKGKQRHADVTKMSRSQRDKSVTREEKRREEKKEEPPTPASGGSTGGKRKKTASEEHPHFARFWATYPRHTARDKAAESFAKIDPDDAMFAVILAAIDAQKRWDQWTKDDGRFIPHPATWLNQKRWLDEPPERLRPTGPATSTVIFG